MDFLFHPYGLWSRCDLDNELRNVICCHQPGLGHGASIGEERGFLKTGKAKLFYINCGVVLEGFSKPIIFYYLTIILLAMTKKIEVQKHCAPDPA
jgi:hypothetical protein